jgi:hypothetical protein
MDSLYGVLNEALATAQNDVTDEIYEHVRTKLEEALTENVRKHNAVIMAWAEEHPLSHDDLLEFNRYEGFAEGVERVAKILGIDVYEPYEPNV